MRKWIKPPKDDKIMNIDKDCQHDNTTDRFTRKQRKEMEENGRFPVRCKKCPRWIYP